MPWFGRVQVHQARAHGAKEASDTRRSIARMHNVVHVSSLTRSDTILYTIASIRTRAALSVAHMYVLRPDGLNSSLSKLDAIKYCTVK